MSSIGKMLTIIFFAVMVFIFFSSFTVAYETPECAYGTFDAWYSKDGIEWQNTTVDYADLKRGEPFYIEATVSTKIESIWVAMELSETGESSSKGSSFEAIDGPCDMYETFDLGEIYEKNTSFTYTWKLRVKPDTDWAGGNAPLNIFAQFDKNVNGEWHTEDISFTAVNVYILDELWEGYTGDDDTNGDGETSNAPGFELVIILAAVSLLVLKRRKN